MSVAERAHVLELQTETIEPKQNKHWLFKPGQSANPAGRPKGSRNKLGQAFCDDLYARWQEKGIEVIDRVIEQRPHEFLKVIAQLMPKEIRIERTDEMSDDQLSNHIKRLAAELQLAIGIIDGADRALTSVIDVTPNSSVVNDIDDKST